MKWLLLLLSTLKSDYADFSKGVATSVTPTKMYDVEVEVILYRLPEDPIIIREKAALIIAPKYVMLYAKTWRVEVTPHYFAYGKHNKMKYEFVQEHMTCFFYDGEYRPYLIKYPNPELLLNMVHGYSLDDMKGNYFLTKVDTNRYVNGDASEFGTLTHEFTFSGKHLKRAVLNTGLPIYIYNGCYDQYKGMSDFSYDLDVSSNDIYLDIRGKLRSRVKIIRRLEEAK